MNEEGEREKSEETICRRISGAESARSVAVSILATRGEGKNPVDFTIESGLKNPQNGYLVFNKKKDAMRKSDFYLIEFTLDDDSGLGLRFEPNPVDAFWVAMGDNVSPPHCPQSASYDSTVYVVSDPASGDKLIVRNDDDVLQFFRFSLGFVDSTGAQHRFDPIAQNQNGGIGNAY